MSVCPQSSRYGFFFCTDDGRHPNHLVRLCIRPSWRVHFVFTGPQSTAFSWLVSTNRPYRKVLLFALYTYSFFISFQCTSHFHTVPYSFFSDAEALLHRIQNIGLVFMELPLLRPPSSPSNLHLPTAAHLRQFGLTQGKNCIDTKQTVLHPGFPRCSTGWHWTSAMRYTFTTCINRRTCYPRSS